MAAGIRTRALALSLIASMLFVAAGDVSSASPGPLGHRFASETRTAFARPGLFIVSASGDRFFVPSASTDETLVYEWDGTEWRPAPSVPARGRIAVSGDRVAIRGSDTVSLYGWDSTTWQHTDTLLLSEEASGCCGAMAMTEDRVVVGSGAAVYVFDRDGATWRETKLIPSQPRLGDGFGRAVDASGDRIVVGAHTDPPFQTGAVYIFDWDGEAWQETKLKASDAGGDDHLGVSVALWGDRVVAGAPYDPDGGTRGGSVYVFDWTGTAWQETELSPISSASPPVVGDLASTPGRFGSSVGVEGDRVVVGAPDLDRFGGAFVYDWDGSTWTETTIAPSQRVEHGLFGRDVALANGRLVTVGSSNVVQPPGIVVTRGSAVYVYEFFEDYSLGRCLILPRPAGVACPSSLPGPTSP